MLDPNLQNPEVKTEDLGVDRNPSLNVQVNAQDKTEHKMTKQEELVLTTESLSHRFKEIVGQIKDEKIATDARSSGSRFSQLSPEDQQAITELAKVKYPSAEEIKQLKEIVDRYLQKQPGDLDKGYFAAAFDDTVCGAGIKQYVERIAQLEPEAVAEERGMRLAYRNQMIEDIYKNLPEETRKVLDQTCPDRTTDDASFKIIAEGKKYAASLSDPKDYSLQANIKLYITLAEEQNMLLRVNPATAPVDPVPTPTPTPAPAATNQQQVAQWERDYYNNRIIAGNDPEKQAGGLNKVLSVLDPEALKAINEKQYTNLEDKISDMVKAFQAAANKMDGLKALAGSPTMDPRVGEFLRQDPNGKFDLTPGALATMEAVYGQIMSNPQKWGEVQAYSDAILELSQNQKDKEFHFRNNPNGTPLPPANNQQQQASWELSYYNERIVMGNDPTKALGGLSKILSVIDPEALKAINEQYTSNGEEKISAMVKAFQAAANKDSRLVNLMSSRPDAVEFLKQDPSGKFTLTEGALKTMEGFTGIMLGDPKYISETANYGAAVRDLRQNFTDKTNHFRNNPEGTSLTAQAGLTNTAINTLEKLLKDPVPAGANPAERLTNLLTGLQNELSQGQNRIVRENPLTPGVVRFMNQRPPVLDADAIAAISAFAGKMVTDAGGRPDTDAMKLRTDAAAQLRENFVGSKMEALIDSIIPGTSVKLADQFVVTGPERISALLKAFQDKLKDNDDGASMGFRNMYGATHPEIARFAAQNPPKLDADALNVLATWCGRIGPNGPSDPVRLAQTALIADIRRTMILR